MHGDAADLNLCAEVPRQTQEQFEGVLAKLATEQQGLKREWT